MHLVPPDPAAVARAFNEAGADFILIGGFAVIAHSVLRTTEDSDLLIPDDETNDRAIFDALLTLDAVGMNGEEVTVERITQRSSFRMMTPGAGTVDLIRGGLPPLDLESVLKRSINGTVHGAEMRIAGLESLVAFKRLAGRPRDLADLSDLEAVHGPLPASNLDLD
jgi:hypothetical protein